MAVRHDDILRVLSAFEQGDWEEIHLVTEEVELHLSTAPGGFSAQAWDVSAERPSSATATPALQDGDRGIAVADAAVAGARPGTEEITAPSPGIFWRSPLPGAPPFAELGRHVAAGDTLCIIEVMKLMNHITAHVSGTMADILVGNGQPVSRGQVLFRIRPDGD